MNVTVAVLSYAMQRWTMMTEAIAAITGQLADGDDVLLVVDHNDELLGRAAEYFAESGSIQVVANAGPPGISGARNTAVAHATGEIIAFLDDDAVADPGWLERVRDVLAEPGVVAVGTAAVPAWSGGPRPEWFPDEYDWVVGCTYRGLPTTTAEVRNVIGAAMAFRREVFDAVGGFSAVVGRRGTAYTGCEETEFCIRVRQRDPGARIMYLPDVAVAHRVPRARMTVRHFLRRCYGEGLSKARVARLVGSTDALASERSYVRSTLPRGLARELWRGVRGQPGGWLAALLIVAGVGVTGTGYVVSRLRREAVTAVPAEVGAVAGR
jgi:GT2 family glycosyltransferase